VSKSPAFTGLMVLPAAAAYRAAAVKAAGPAHRPLRACLQWLCHGFGSWHRSSQECI